MVLPGRPTLGLLAAAAGVARAQQVPLAHSFADKGPVLDVGVRAKISRLVQLSKISWYSLASYSEGAGQETCQWGNMTENGDAVAADNIFGLASVSKAFTALALGLVMDDFKHGRNVTALPGGLAEFTWATKLKDVLPEDWKLMDGWASEAISIRDYLSHVSGIPNGHDVIRRLRHLRSAFELPETWNYSNLGYMVAQHLVEKFSQQSLAEFVTARIFRPLNMTSSSYSVSSAAATGRLSEFYYEGRRIPPVLAEDDMLVIAGAAGALSTAEDMMKWGRLLLGTTASEAVGIPRQILQDCMSPQVLMLRGASPTYGFGWFQKNVLGTELVFHPGDMPGASTAIVLLPQHKIAIAQLANVDGALAVNSAVIATILAGVLSPTALDTPATIDLFSSNPPHSDTQTGVSDAFLSAGDLNAFAGTYEGAGYGGLVLCSSRRPSSACETVLSNFERLDGSMDNTIYGYYQSPVLLVKEIRLDALDTNVFSFQATTLFPDGYGANTTAFEVNIFSAEAGLTARFDVSADGSIRRFGVFGLEGEGLERERTATTIEGQAEVWFKRVDRVHDSLRRDVGAVMCTVIQHCSR